MPISSTPDHVAIAVPSIEEASPRWRDELGGAWLSPPFSMEAAGFATRQLHYPGGAKLELLEPVGADSFGARFLDRFGAQVHHVTIKVPDLLAAVDELRREGFEPVDIYAEGDIWHEAFLRPSQIGGLIVQVAWQGRTDAEWAALLDVPPEPVREDAATLLGPALEHPDLEVAARIWQALGAVVQQHDDHLDIGWPDAPLTVRIDRGERAGPRGIRFAGGPSLPRDPRFGAAVLPT